MKLNLNLVVGLLLLTTQFSTAQTIIPLYNGTIEGAKKDANYTEKQHIGDDGKKYISFVSTPTLTVFAAPADKANGAAVIIYPGGGYQVLAVEHEGEELAKRFNEFGITAFVLKYRLPNDAIMVNKAMAPLQDAQQALILVRKNAAKWKIDANKIGIVGASAGGHLAASVGTHFNKAYVANADNISLRPDFMILLYPRISFELGVESSSANNLVGPVFKADQMDFFSLEKHVTTTTPPTFLVHASDDEVVKVEHSLLFYKALIAKKVPAEMHIYRAGGHGFGLHNKTNSDDWFLRVISWLKGVKVI